MKKTTKKNSTAVAKRTKKDSAEVAKLKKHAEETRLCYAQINIQLAGTIIDLQEQLDSWKGLFQAAGAKIKNDFDDLCWTVKDTFRR
jgi:hypothetical protein